MNNLIIKVYKPDYSFIIDNYLDQSLWGKEYTVYEYREFKVIVQLQKIDVIEKELTFTVKTPDLLYSGTHSRTVNYKMNHPEYTINILIKKINLEIESQVKRYFGIKNYEQVYNVLKSNYNDEYNVYYDLYNEEIIDLFDELPELIQKYFRRPDNLLSELVEKKVGLEPSKLGYSEKHYIQELEIYKGVKKKIDSADFGTIDIKIDEELTIAIKQNDGGKLTEEEQEIYENWAENVIEELKTDFDGNVENLI